jgi:hypothetical protein
MRIVIKIILTFVVLIIGLMGAGAWPYLPAWIGMNFSLLMLVLTVYTVYQIWKKKTPNVDSDENDSNLNDKTS